MKSILMLFSILALNGIAYAQTPPAKNIELPEITHNSLKSEASMQITPDMKCQDFIRVEKYDNQVNQDKANVRDHINQFGMILSPYYVRDQRGKIYQPALGYLILNISSYCDNNPQSNLIDSVRQSAKSLVELVENANKETASDIQNKQQDLGK